MLGEISLASVYWIGCCFSCFASLSIKSYHLSKPLGMQTILGKFIVLFAYIYIVSIAVFALAFTVGIIFAPLGLVSDSIALLVTGGYYVGSQTFFMAMSACLIVKYISIYHSTLWEHIEEDRLLYMAKLVLTAATVFSAFIEYTYFSDMANNRYYQFFRFGTNSGQGAEVTKILLFLFTFQIMVGLQFRLEVDNFRFGENSLLLRLAQKLRCVQDVTPADNNEEQQQGKEEYKMGVLRTLVILGAVIISTFVYMHLVRIGNMGLNVLPGFLTVSTFIPAVFIANHQGLKNHILSKYQIFSL